MQANRENKHRTSEATSVQAKCREEIERAIDNLKRSNLDRWFRRKWYDAGRRGGPALRVNPSSQRQTRELSPSPLGEV